MRAILSLFLTAQLWATTCAYAQTDEVPYQIDEQATAQAPWNVGDIIAEDNIDIGDADTSAIYRKFIGMTSKGYFVVQDFYKESHKKASSPFVITIQDAVHDIPSVYIFDLFEGVQIAWYENGQKAIEGQIQDGEHQGGWTLWSQSGQKELEAFYEDGKLQGFRTSWYGNGQKSSEKQFLDGQNNGSQTYWYDNGQKEEEAQYLNGELQGIFTKWYENGQKMEEGQYQNGKQQGLWSYWYENGVEESGGLYQDGEQQGLWIKWNEQGKKISETMYEAGKKVSKKTFKLN